MRNVLMNPNIAVCYRLSAELLLKLLPSTLLRQRNRSLYLIIDHCTVSLLIYN